MVQSVSRAVRILRELAAGGPRLGVTELAARVGVAKPTIHALLRTLEGEGLVVQDAETGKYQLGPGLLQLGNAYLDTQELRARSLTWADTLANQTNEAVWVAVLTGDHVFVVHHAFRPEGAVQILEVGASIPWSTCALGKAIVAFLPPKQQSELLAAELPALTGWSVTDPVVLAEQLEAVRGSGYALEDQESALGDAGVAAPVFDRSGGVAGAIGIVGPVERLFDGAARQDHIVAVREVVWPGARVPDRLPALRSAALPARCHDRAFGAAGPLRSRLGVTS
jgi:DNA-binding IclR family transcriptional regulator